MTVEEKLKRHDYVFHKVSCYNEVIEDDKTPEEREEMFKLREELQKLGLVDSWGRIIRQEEK